MSKRHRGKAKRRVNQNTSTCIARYPNDLNIYQFSDLVQAYRRLGIDNHYFDSAVMKYYGDSLSNYYLENIHLNVWALKRHKPVKHGNTKTCYWRYDVESHSLLWHDDYEVAVRGIEAVRADAEIKIQAMVERAAKLTGYHIYTKAEDK